MQESESFRFFEELMKSLELLDIRLQIYCWRIIVLSGKKTLNIQQILHILKKYVFLAWILTLYLSDMLKIHRWSDKFWHIYYRWFSKLPSLNRVEPFHYCSVRSMFVKNFVFKILRLALPKKKLFGCNMRNFLDFDRSEQRSQWLWK